MILIVHLRPRYREWRNLDNYPAHKDEVGNAYNSYDRDVVDVVERWKARTLCLGWDGLENREC